MKKVLILLLGLILGQGKLLAVEEIAIKKQTSLAVGGPAANIFTDFNSSGFNPTFDNWDKLFFITNSSNHYYRQTSKVELSLKLNKPGANFNKNFTYTFPIKVRVWMTNSTAPTRTYNTELKIEYKQPIGSNANINNKLITSFVTANYYRIEVTANGQQTLDIDGTTINSATHARLINDDMDLELISVITTDRNYKVTPLAISNSYNIINDNLLTTPLAYNPSQQGNVANVNISWGCMNSSCLNTYSPVNTSDIVPDEIDLEWTFVDRKSKLGNAIFHNNNSTTSTTHFSTFIFGHLDLNYTRVTLKSPTIKYSIPLTYPEGYILYRIRLVSFNNLGLRLESDWHYSNFLGTGSKSNIIYVKPHQDNLNWTSSITFAEEGKRKEMVSYFDGSQRDRQTVTLNNTNSVAFISESMYDFDGRKVITTLPAPKLLNVSMPNNSGLPGISPPDYSVPGNTLKFYSGFSLKNANTVYRESDYNKNPPNGCDVLPSEPMSPLSGASQYFSTQNYLYNNTSIPESERYLAQYTPNAFNYPFIQTKFSNDGTNRPIFQSGVGINHRIASGQETKYYYTNVKQQKELDRLFGTEIGKKEFYSKMFTTDPNGQTSVTYQDAKGNTIATALIGDKPADLDGLNSPNPSNDNTSNYVSISRIQYDFIETANMKKSYEDFALTQTSPHFVPVNNESIDLTLDFKAGSFIQDLCKLPTQKTGCIDCYYDINLRVIDNCGNQILNNDYKNYDDPPAINFLCDNNTPSPRPNVFIPSIPLNGLNKGEYQISASVTVPEKYVDLYTDKYMQEMELCEEYDLQKFVQKQLDLIDDYSCIKNCAECNTLKDRGIGEYTIRTREKLKNVESQYTPAQFTQMVNDIAQLQYNKLVARCADLCKGKYKAECNFYRELLLKDVSKGGQYGMRLNATTKQYELEDVSVLHAAVRNPLIKLNGEELPNVQVVVDNWREEWAEILIQYHPEYCYYQKCLDREGVNTLFEIEFEKLNTINCNELSNTLGINQKPLLGVLNNVDFPITEFMTQYNDFKFFSTNVGAIGRPLKEWAFIFAFSGYPEFSLDPSVSANDLYSLNNFKGKGSTAANPCLNGYCEQDRNLYWYTYKILLKNLKDYFKNFYIKDGTTNQSPAKTNEISTGCVKNYYISCGTAAANQQNTKIEIKGPKADLFDGFFSSNSSATPPCTDYNSYLIMNFKDHTNDFNVKYYGSDFNNKQRRFPDYQKMASKLIDAINNMSKSDGESVADDISASNKSEMCKTQSLGWINLLRQCLTSRMPYASKTNPKTSLKYTLIDLEKEIRENLEKVCAVHCGEKDYPSGSKTTDPSKPGVVVKIYGIDYTVRSFQEVIDIYKGSASSDPLCTSDIIDLPNFGTKNNNFYSSVQYEQFSLKKESCECDQIRMWKAKFVKSGQSNFRTYMQSQDASFNLTAAELQQLEDGCASTSIKCRFFPKKIALPESFKCKKYFTCYEIEILKDAFYKKYKDYNFSSLPSTSLVFQDAITGFFNTSKGMNLSYYDYEKFLKDCEGCVTPDFIEKNTLYQGIYNKFISSRPPGSKFPSFGQDNLKILANYYNAELNITDPNKKFTPYSILAVFCKYLVNTNNAIPCCVLDHYNRYIATYSPSSNQPSYIYYALMRDKINAWGKYRLSLNDYIHVLKYCGGIDICPRYRCKDLDIKWREYDALLKAAQKDKKPVTIDGVVQTKESYLNLVLAQYKTMAEFTSEYNNLCTKPYSTNNTYLTSACENCPAEFDQMMNAYVAYLSSSPVTDYEITTIDWNNIDPNFIEALDQNHGYSTTRAQFKALYNHPKCNKFNCELIKEYIKRFRKTIGITSNTVKTPISSIPGLISFLNDKVGQRSDWLAKIKECDANNDFCARFKTINDKYKDYLNLPANINFVIDWDNIPADMISYINSQNSGDPITAADFRYMYDNYRSCFITECTELSFYFNRYKTAKGYTNGYIPPSVTADMLSHLSTFMRRNITQADIEVCQITNFCNMYKSIYDAYIDYLDLNSSFVTNWNQTNDWNNPTGLLTFINSQTGKTVSSNDLKIIFKDYRLKCYTNECDELNYYFNRYLVKKGIALNKFGFKNFKECIDDLYLYFDKTEPASFWTEKLKKCNVFDMCIIYTNVFNAIVKYHENTPTFNINWSNVDGALISFVETETGNSDLTGAMILESFNNSACHNKYDCRLIKHYYDLFQSMNGTLISNSNSSITGLIAFLNSKFDASLNFKEWLAHMRKCEEINIDDHIVPCDGLRECLLVLLTDYQTLTKQEVVDMATSIDASHISQLTSCVGKDYIREDWVLIFSLCNFDDGCFDKELFSRRYEKNNPNPDLNACNLQSYFEAYKTTFTLGEPCYPFFDAEPCKAVPYGGWRIKCDELKARIEHYLCTEDPMPYLNGNVFNKGQYLEKLRNELNTYFNASLSICDYELLLEACNPCCLKKYFQYLNFTYVYYYFYKTNYDQTNSITWFTLNPGALPWSFTQSGTFTLDFDCNKPGLYCSRVMGYMVVPNPNASGGTGMFTPSNNPIGFGNRLAVELNILNDHPGAITNDDMMMSGLAVQYYMSQCTIDYCSGSDKETTNGDSDENEILPCDQSICNVLRTAFDQAVSDAENDGITRESDFDLWWQTVYDQVNNAIGWDPYPSMEELSLMLHCCGRNKHNIPCTLVQTWIEEFQTILNDLRKKYPGLSDEEILRIFMNGKSGKEETTGYWLSLIKNFCNLELPFPGALNFPCEALWIAFQQDANRDHHWAPGYSKVKELQMQMNLSYNAFVKYLLSCLDCQKFMELMTTNKVFASILHSYYYGQLGKTGSYKDMLAYYLQRFNCEYTEQSIEALFNSMLLLFNMPPQGGSAAPPQYGIMLPPSMQLPSSNSSHSLSNKLISSKKIKNSSEKPLTFSQKFVIPTKRESAPQFSAPDPLSGTGGSSPTPVYDYRELFKGNSNVGNFNFDLYSCCPICEKKLYDRAKYKVTVMPNPCQYLFDLALTNARSEREKIFKQLAIDFRRKYVEKCIDNAQLNVYGDVSDQEHHYTLYYYGQDGKLVQTVPPAGVRKFTTAADFADVVAKRGTQYKAPNHQYITKYWYNMDGQVTKQKTPDAGQSIFVYDEAGRLILSQNAKQAPDKFSYTKYDKLNRILESGQINATGIPPGSNAMHLNMTYYHPAGNGNGRNIHRMSYCNFEKFLLEFDLNFNYRHVVRTYYDRTPSIATLPAMSLENLNKRIAVTTLDEQDNDKLGTTFSSALMYSYDILGNVKRIYTHLQSTPTTAALPSSERLKTIDYIYDLQSGKVNKVYYQQGQPDQYIHRYSYDAENRLVAAMTSFDDHLYTTEATYKYYLHGPLARTQIGDRLVQGLDYVYTIQGWLKSVNGSTLNNSLDPGKDGGNAATAWPTAPLPFSVQADNKNVAHDAIAFSIDYFNNTVGTNTYSDYHPTGVNNFLAAKLSPKSLYNGNIVSMKVSNRQFNTATNPSTMGYMYDYDQLHRIVGLQARKGTTNAVTNDYAESVAYDPNGNILDYNRNGDNTTAAHTVPLGSANPNMDKLKYFYYKEDAAGVKTQYDPATVTLSAGEKLTNQLAMVADAVSGSVHDKDIEAGQASNNYQYDKIGNLIYDDQENMTISWTPTGKIDEISINKPGPNNQKLIKFAYDPMGQRIYKAVYNNLTATGTPQYTYYARDAQGNTIATYDNTAVNNGEVSYPHKLSEYHIYGSSRLGIKRPKRFRGQLMASIGLEEDNPWGDVPWNDPNFIYYISASATPSGTNYQEDILEEEQDFNNPWLILAPRVKLIQRFSSLSEYELTNHLGNVLATIKDEEHNQFTTASLGFGPPNKSYVNTPIILSATDYYPFGMPMPNRTYSLSSSKYRFGFNGKEKENDLYGEGNAYDYSSRMYDSRIGKWLSVDPLSNKYPSLSPYHFCANNPIIFKDPDGKEWKYAVEKGENGEIKAITITFTAAIVNESKKVISPADMSKLKDIAIKQIQETYSGDFDGIKVTTVAEIRVIKNKSELNSTEHIFRIKSDAEQKGDKADIGGREIFIKHSTAMAVLKGKDKNVFAHEGGHTAMLLHPDQDYSKLKRDDAADLSRWQKYTNQSIINENGEYQYDGKNWSEGKVDEFTTGLDNLMGETPGNSTKLNTIQIKAMVEASDKGLINRNTINNNSDQNNKISNDQLKK